MSVGDDITVDPQELGDVKNEDIYQPLLKGLARYEMLGKGEKSRGPKKVRFETSGRLNESRILFVLSLQTKSNFFKPPVSIKPLPMENHHGKSMNQVTK